MKRIIQYSRNCHGGFVLLPGLNINNFLTNHNKTYKVITFILYTIYIVGDKHLCRGRYDGRKTIDTDNLKD